MSTIPDAASGTARTQSAPRRVALAGGIGTLVEYYDFALYGYMATIIAPLFFPSDDPVAALLSTLIVFALAYVVRPLGGIFFGHIGDKYGRRKALMITIIGIGLANTAIGLLPTHATIGILAPTLLILVRVIQGFFAGGEVGGAATVIAEAAPPGKKAAFGAFVPMGTNGGFALASAVAGIVTGIATADQLNDWAWRIPFLIALPLTIICFLVRRTLPDIDKELDLSSKHSVPLLRVLRHYPGSLAKALGIGIAMQGGAYIGLTFMTIYLVNNLGYNRTNVYWLTTGIIILAVAAMPLTGRLSDRIGPLKVALIGILGYTILTYPALVVMGMGNFLFASIAYFFIMINMSFLQVASFTLSPQLFDDEVRYTGMALVTNFSVVIAGGSAPYVATLLVEKTGDLRSPYYFVLVASCIGLIAVATLWKQRKTLG
ncbi:MFS transporter [Rhodococcus sp. IEGM 1381]|uniref:MFS transporter n=1 Tax=Rhodococcus sp. IEGM 1381 TaxID=3047085 RepID=UPI0024B6FEE0|nr:MFS transporter [Rhodococcus sp. IEGM 1381]MDI9897459.1 MFS transporter [Rhodococcus sp. IEGM 1381]